MGSPKHLWSGDWEAHSRDAPVAPPAPPRIDPPAPAPAAAASRRSPRRGLVLGAGLLLVLVVVGVVLAATLGGSSHPAGSHAAASAASPATPNSGGQGLAPTTSPAAPTGPVSVGPLYDWLGMQVSDAGTGPTVATITENSPADIAGVDPGDVIVSVDNVPINTVVQLRAAVAKLALGHRFTFTVDRGSTAVTITATLANRPTKVS